MRFFREQFWYIMPETWEIRRELNKLNMRSEEDFMLDLIAKCGGGEELVTPDGIDVRQRDFINSFDLNDVPGATPMRKALNLLQVLRDANEAQKQSPNNNPLGRPLGNAPSCPPDQGSGDKKGKGPKQQGGNSASGGAEGSMNGQDGMDMNSPNMSPGPIQLGAKDPKGNPLPPQPKSFVQQFLENQRSVAKVGELLSAVLQNFHNVSKSEFSLMGGEPVKVMKTLLTDGDFIKLSRELDRITNFAIERTTKRVSDKNGTETRMRTMKDFNEVNRAPAEFWALPKVLRTLRLATHGLVVREKISPEIRKMLFYMLIDVSGSMSSGNKRGKAMAVLFNRLNSVIRGEGEMFFRFFDTKVSKMFEVRTADAARVAIELIRANLFAGGGTDISGSLRFALKDMKELKEKHGFVKPDLVIVTDGEDRLDVTMKDLDGTKLHAFICDGRNDQLVTLAQDSGGAALASF